MNSRFFCEVALPVPLRSTFTYAVPKRLAAADLTGSRVVAPFRNRSLVGVALKCAAEIPLEAEIKEIAAVVDDIPALTPELLALGKWVSRYYVAPIGETLRSMLPPHAEMRGLRDFVLSEHGRAFLTEAKRHGASTVDERKDLDALTALGFENAAPVSTMKVKGADGEAVVRRLIRRGIVTMQHRVQRKQERTRTIVSWNSGEPAADEREEKIREILRARGPSPLHTLMQEGISRAVLARLEKAQKVACWEEQVANNEDSWDADFTPPANVLNAEQEKAARSIREWIAAGHFTAALLHGVTGSGKTEVYLAAIEAALAAERTAIVLVPEIALTLWMSRLLRGRFGATAAVLHSGLNDRERAREWWRVRRGEARVVVGTRSAAFAPLDKLGLIIVDEEQEGSYKQEETPRYNGRDTAVYRAHLANAVALLGSATPSLESFQNARSGKYKLLELRARVQGRPLASARIVDLRKEFERTHRSEPLSEQLITEIQKQLEGEMQALILINRRGYSWYVLCRSCGAGIECKNCSIALSYYKRRARLECHYCGYATKVPSVCPKCNSRYLYFVGDGAERVEEFLRERLPKARIGRLDRDSVRSKREYQKVLGAFARAELDLLVGTQMVAKGHDFERVTLVGVAAADTALGRPDFRAAERTFQLLTQVAGRAGRGRFPGEVMIEAYYPDHYAIQHALKQDYAGFFEREIYFRKMMHYPPFVALANIVVRDRKLENAIRWSKEIAAYLDSQKSEQIKALGPAAAVISKLRRDFRFQILLKSPNRNLLGQKLEGCLRFCAKRRIPETAVIVDVDPVNLL